MDEAGNVGANIYDTNSADEGVEFRAVMKLSRVGGRAVEDETFAVRVQHVVREVEQKELADDEDEPQGIVQGACGDNEAYHFVAEVRRRSA